MGSADLMERNLDRRVEVLFPVTDSDLMARLDEVLDLDLADDTNSWLLGPDAKWSRLPTVKGVSVQRRLQQLARERVRHWLDVDST
jgi:polyphosphate kinase